MLPAKARLNSPALVPEGFQSVGLTVIRTRTGEELAKPILMDSEPRIHGGKLTLEKNLPSIPFWYGTGRALKKDLMDSPFS